MSILMLSCKKASELTEKALQFSLNPIEKIQLYLHTSICNSCRSYESHSKNMDVTLHKHMFQKTSISDESNKGLSDDFKKTIIEKLEDKK